MSQWNPNPDNALVDGKVNEGVSWEEAQFHVLGIVLATLVQVTAELKSPSFTAPNEMKGEMLI